MLINKMIIQVLILLMLILYIYSLNEYLISGYLLLKSDNNKKVFVVIITNASKTKILSQVQDLKKYSIYNTIDIFLYIFIKYL